MRVINTLVSAPITVIVFVLGFVQPFITIVGTFFIVFLFSFGIVTFSLYGLSDICKWGLLPETICFISLSTGSIIISTSYATTMWIVRHSPNRDWKEHKFESYREQLAIYLIQPSNVVFLLYVAYFVFLAITGYLQIQKGEFLISMGYDNAVLKAFLVFIAYTNIRTKWKVAELDVKHILSHTLKLFEFK